MTDLIPQFGGFAFTIIAFVVALSIIVAIHEYGHYIVGRWSGIHAEVFSLGFGPVLASRVDKHGTKWQFAALPSIKSIRRRFVLPTKNPRIWSRESRN